MPSYHLNRGENVLGRLLLRLFTARAKERNVPFSDSDHVNIAKMAAIDGYEFKERTRGKPFWPAARALAGDELHPDFWGFMGKYLSSDCARAHLRQRLSNCVLQSTFCNCDARSSFSASRASWRDVPENILAPWFWPLFWVQPDSGPFSISRSSISMPISHLS